jgi:hypothetical protein
MMLDTVEYEPSAADFEALAEAESWHLREEIESNAREWWREHAATAEEPSCNHEAGHDWQQLVNVATVAGWTLLEVCARCDAERSTIRRRDGEVCVMYLPPMPQKLREMVVGEVEDTLQGLPDPARYEPDYDPTEGVIRGVNVLLTREAQAAAADARRRAFRQWRAAHRGPAKRAQPVCLGGRARLHRRPRGRRVSRVRRSRPTARAPDGDGESEPPQAVASAGRRSTHISGALQ